MTRLLRPLCRLLSLLVLISLALTFPSAANAAVGVGPGGGTPGTSSNFELVGHNALFNRGMNAALTIFDHYVYVGNRTDGSSTCGVGDPRGPGANCPHPHPGVLIVDVKNPTNPTIVGEIGPPLEGNAGITSRELRVLPQPNLLIVDISQVFNGGPVTEVAEGNWNNRYPGADNPANYNFNLFVHSMGVSADGTRTYLAMEAGEFLVLDTSDIANNVPNPQLRLLTDPANRPIWGNPAPCSKNCPNGHSAVQVPGRSFALTTDEVYGTFTDPSFGCPWGWARLISVSDPTHPTIVGEYQITQDQQSFCGSSGDDSQTEQFTSYSSHNPKVLPDLALIAWHSGGLKAIDISDPTHPSQSGWFSPTPLSSVANEDPALSRGPNKVVMWSYPIISKGLIYVVDIRNGLYVLQYTGPHADEVKQIHFLEGNSNLGDAVELGLS